METTDAIKQAYPQINWERFEDMDRALNWELWHGPLPSNYWTEVEPLDHYEWRGFIQAERDITEILDPLPAEIWFDKDADYVSTSDPEEDESNWLFTCQFCGELIRKVDNQLVENESEDPMCPQSDEGHSEDWNKQSVWIGGENWWRIDPRKELMHVETWKQVF